MKIALKVQSIIEHKPGQLRVTFVPPTTGEKRAGNERPIDPSAMQNSQLHVLVDVEQSSFQVGTEYSVAIS